MHASIARKDVRSRGGLPGTRGGGKYTQCLGKVVSPLPQLRPFSAPWPWKGWDSPLEASSVRAGRSGPSGLNPGHSMSGRHILRRGRGRETGWGVSPGSPLPKRLPPRRMRSGKLIPSCHLLPDGVGKCLRRGNILPTGSLS